MLPDSSPAPEGERDHLGRFYADLDFGGRPMPAGEIKYMRQGLIPCRRCAFWVNHSCRAKAPLSQPGSQYVYWPSTLAVDGCGEGLLREEAAPLPPEVR